MLPHFFSLCNLSCGIYAVYLALQGNIFQAACLIFAAMFFDFLDGKVAQLMNTISEFGSELDSLVDIISFGIAPVIIVYMTSVGEYKSLLYLSGFLYMGCGAIRLSMHNVRSRHGSANKDFFHGLPILVAAGFIMSLVVLHLDFKHPFFFISILLFMILAAFLMISHIRYPRLSHIKLVSKKLFLAVFLLLAAASFLYFKFIPLLCFTAYSLIGILMEAQKWNLRRKKGNIAHY
ncbi:MAG: CDP-diacylglycerol--serine O-phosphatidyltransferase [Candidatus Gorgyraea atricola]|nr:CDP-diacylglycerol--serine O-phosphatidyltransferase [Candidatus Gorgyraea atricola]